MRAVAVVLVLALSGIAHADGDAPARSVQSLHTHWRDAMIRQGVVGLGAIPIGIALVRDKEEEKYGTIGRVVVGSSIFVGGLVVGGAWLWMSNEPTTEDEARTRARQLFVGGTVITSIGAGVMLTGYFMSTSRSDRTVLPIIGTGVGIAGLGIALIDAARMYRRLASDRDLSIAPTGSGVALAGRF